MFHCLWVLRFTDPNRKHFSGASTDVLTVPQREAVLGFCASLSGTVLMANYIVAKTPADTRGMA